MFQSESHDPVRMEPGDSVVVPAGLQSTLARGSSDLELLEVRLPAGSGTRGS